MSANSPDRGAPAPLRSFLATLGHERRSNVSDEVPPWFEPGVTSVVDEAIYDYFRQLGSRKAQGDGWFVAGRGIGPFRLFWRWGPRFYGRELTDTEVRRFGELSGVSLIAWAQWASPESDSPDQGDGDAAE